MRAAPLVALLTGCSSIFGLDDPALREDSGGGIDAPPFCLGQGELEICVPRPTQPLALTAMLDTSNCDRIEAVCVMAGTDVVIDDARAIGTAPLVVLAVNTLTVKGTLDVAAHAGMLSPAAGNLQPCAPLNDGAQNALGGGGGAGGSFASMGGHGGKGASGMTAGANAHPATTLPSGLRGGCKGGLGGAAESAQAGQPGGAGGAVYLLAGMSLQIEGMVNASGGGGDGGLGAGGAGSRVGGNGGGSGGMIALWSPVISVTGVLIANGGGGGGGGDAGGIGSRGEDPMSPEAAARGGIGGNSNACGVGPGCGGDGAIKVGAADDGLTDATNAGGGGGGGGLGFIRVVSGQAITGKISPTPTLE